MRLSFVEMAPSPSPTGTDSKTPHLRLKKSRTRSGDFELAENVQRNHTTQNASGKKKDNPSERESLSPTCLLENVFQEQGPRIYRLALRLVGNESDAEDVTQDVLLQVVRKLHTFRGESSLFTWLYRITTNAARALGRKRAALRERQLGPDGGQSVEERPLPGLSRPAALPPDEQVQGKELSQLIEDAVASLPPLYHEVFVLADIDGLANAEIGRRLGLSLPAVKSRLHRGRLLMRQALAPHFERDLPE